MKKSFKSTNVLHSLSIVEELFLFSQSDYYLWNQFIPLREKLIKSKTDSIKNKEHYKNYLNMKMNKYNKLNSFEILAGFLAIIIFVSSIVATTIMYQEHNRNIDIQTSFEYRLELHELRKHLSQLISEVTSSEIHSELVAIRMQFDQEVWNGTAFKNRMLITWTAIDALCRSGITHTQEFEDFEVLLDLRDDLSVLINKTYNKDVIEQAERIFLTKILKLLLQTILIYIAMYKITMRFNRNNSVKSHLLNYQLNMLCNSRSDHGLALAFWKMAGQEHCQKLSIVKI